MRCIRSRQQPLAVVLTSEPMLQMLPPEIVQIAKHVMALVAQGLPREDILARLADPASVGGRMLDFAIERKTAGEAYLKPAADPRFDGIMIRTNGEVVTFRPKSKGKKK